MLKAYHGGAVTIADFASSFPLLDLGYLARTAVPRVFTLTPAGVVEARRLETTAWTPMDTEGDIRMITEDGVVLLVEDGDRNVERVWSFLYHVTYPRINTSDWTFTWNVESGASSVPTRSTDDPVTFS